MQLNISIELHFMLTRKYIFKSIWIVLFWVILNRYHFHKPNLGMRFNNSVISMMNASEWRHAYKKSKGKCTSDYFLNFSLIYGSDNVQIMSHDAETYTMDVTMVVNFCYRVAYYCHRHIYLLTPARTQCRIGL